MSKYITDKRYTMLLLFIILIVILVFAGIILKPFLIEQNQISLNTASEISSLPTATALPPTFPDVIPDYFENQNGTIGLLAGSVVLVLVILFGVLISIRNNEK